MRTGCGVYRKLSEVCLKLHAESWVEPDIEATGYRLHGNRFTYQDQSRVQVEIVGHNDSSHYTQTLQRRESDHKCISRAVGTGPAGPAATGPSANRPAQKRRMSFSGFNSCSTSTPAGINRLLYCELLTMSREYACHYCGKDNKEHRQ